MSDLITRLRIETSRQKLIAVSSEAADRIEALEKQNAELLAALQAERNKQSASYCKDGDRCVCGGDLPRVRECCGNWVKAIQPSTQEVSK